MNTHRQTLQDRRDISRFHKSFLHSTRIKPKKDACPIQAASRQVTKDVRKFRTQQQRKQALRPTDPAEHLPIDTLKP